MTPTLYINYIYFFYVYYYIIDCLQCLYIYIHIYRHEYVNAYANFGMVPPRGSSTVELYIVSTCSTCCCCCCHYYSYSYSYSYSTYSYSYSYSYYYNTIEHRGVGPWSTVYVHRYAPTQTTGEMGMRVSLGGGVGQVRPGISMYTVTQHISHKFPTIKVQVWDQSTQRTFISKVIHSFTEELLGNGCLTRKPPIFLLAFYNIISSSRVMV